MDMIFSQQTRHPDVERISRQAGRRAGNLFHTRQLWCAGAVLVALNRGLGGDLTQDLAIRLTAGLGHGLGGGGCVCGGLSGGALALGIFLGHGRRAAAGQPIVLKASRWLHDRFKATHGATCCRALIKGIVPGSKTHMRDCALRTANAAELAAEKILHQRPELIPCANWDFLNQNDNRLTGRLKIAADRLKAG